MTSSILLFTLLGFSISAGQDRLPRQSSVSNVIINNSIKRLEKNIRILENKLSRHEFREAQVADFSTKTLNALTADHGQNRKNMQVVANQLGMLEERLLSLEALIKTIDERQRKKLDGLSDGINRLIIKGSEMEVGGLPPFPGDVSSFIGADMQEMLVRMAKMEDNINENSKKITEEVKVFYEVLTDKINSLGEQQKDMWTELDICERDKMSSITETIAKTGNEIQTQVEQVKDLFKKSDTTGSCAKMDTSILEKLNSLNKVSTKQEKDLSILNKQTKKMLKEQGADIKHLIKESDIEKEINNKIFSEIYDNLSSFDEKSKDELKKLELLLSAIITENSQDIKQKIESLTSTVDEKTSSLYTALEDSAGTVENIQISMFNQFEELTKNIRGLKKVEQVMLNTADAVLDTKRSIEFGIQQVILELSDIVRNSGQNIDSTLSNHMNNISFAILKNQTMALTNMTKKMEDEISQVWRQIGIMYQQITHSVDILGDLQSQTSQQMNASLNKVGTMDGTVGAINNKVADVEDNLNYLLGRLSLVVSEFSHMKTGVGSELKKLREMAQEFSEGKIVEYEVNTKGNV